MKSEIKHAIASTSEKEIFPDIELEIKYVTNSTLSKMQFSNKGLIEKVGDMIYADNKNNTHEQQVNKDFSFIREKYKLTNELVDSIDFFNEKEKEWIKRNSVGIEIFKYFSSEEIAQLGGYNEIKNWGEDDKMKVYRSSGRPSYHADPQCKRMLHDYVNLEIPYSIQELGDEAIKTYRDFFLDPKIESLVKAKKWDILAMHYRHFCLRAFPGLSLPLSSIVVDNTGVSENDLLNYSLQETEEKIKEIKDRERNFYLNEKVPESIRNFVKQNRFNTYLLSCEPRSPKEEFIKSEIWGEDGKKLMKKYHSSYIYPIKKLLRHHYAIQNSEFLKARRLGFNEQILRKLGLSQCPHCHITKK